jgi:FHA domain
MLILREFKHGAPSRVRHIRLIGQLITLGRSPMCEYQLENVGTVSRVQATIKHDTDGWWVVDGAIDRASTSGVFVGDRRLEQPTLLAPGLQISLFRSPEYEANLEMIDDTAAEMLADERSTAEVPLLNVHADMIGLRESIAALARQVADLAGRVDASERSAKSQFDAVLDQLHTDLSRSIANDLGKTLIEKIDALGAELKPQIDNAQSRNDRQDMVIKRVLTGLAMTLIGVSGYKLSQGDSDSVMRGLDLLSMAAGLSGGAAVVLRPHEKEKPK